MFISLQTRRFEFRAEESVFFPPGKAGNIFRGALGLRLPEAAPGGKVPGGFRQPPGPFVLRAAHLDGVTIPPGGTFCLGVNVFDVRNGWMEKVERALGGLTGLGPRRGRMALTGGGLAEEVALDLAAREAVSRVVVRFVTCTELKGLKPGASEVPFEALFRRVRDRLSLLGSLYGEGAPEIDFKGMAERAARVRLVSCDLVHRQVERKSSRTGQTHGIGGFTGAAGYEGELTEFLPWLRAAWWTGVGRHTVWGNGVLACE